MKSVDVAIVGAGLAGSICAGMLEKKGISHTLIDPRTEYPDEFRCEKFNHQQIDLLQETGLAETVLGDLTAVKDVWMSRFGQLVRKQTYPHYGFSYQEAVNAVRRHHVNPENFTQNTVKTIDNSPNKQIIEMTDGAQLSARLVVLATGANMNLQHELGMTQDMLSERHCLAIGFDVEPEGDFEFDTMTYWPESNSGKMSYLTFFRTTSGWRANLFGYWKMQDQEMALLKTKPTACLNEMMPNLQKIVGNFEVSGRLRVRPINLYQWEAQGLNGVAAIGDAWSSSCPGAGTGTTKAINDALVISRKFIPKWIEQNHVSVDDLAAFYKAADKTAIDYASIQEAYKLKDLTLNTSPYWHAQRWLRFLYHGMRGKLAGNQG